MYKVCGDGFVWLVVDKPTAISVFNAGTTDLFALYEDETEGAIDCIDDIEKAFKNDLNIGIEVGFLYDMYNELKEKTND